jgi:hypothetical protein
VFASCFYVLFKFRFVREGTQEGTLVNIRIYIYIYIYIHTYIHIRPGAKEGDVIDKYMYM